MSKEEKMYMQMLPVVDDVYRIFNYIAISKEDYEKMSKSILGELMSGKNDLENIENLYRTRLYDEMLRLGKELINSQEGAYVLVNNFINRRFKNIVKIDGVKSGFKKLDMVLCSYGFMPGIDLLNKLIQENVIVNRLLKMFFDYYSPQIAIGRLEKITDSNTLITLCQLYASLNNLDIKLFEDNDDENDYNYDEVSNVDIIRTYFLEMTRIPLLTLEQERDLAKRVAKGDDDTPEDVVVETMARLQLPDMIEKLFTDCQLNERERSILVLRSTLNGRKRMTLDEVGRAYGVTRERIRQIEKRALLKLRRYVKYYDNIDDFIETYDGTKKIKIKKG